VERCAFPCGGVQGDFRAFGDVDAVFAELLEHPSSTEVVCELGIDARVTNFCDFPPEDAVEAVAVFEHLLCRKAIGRETEVRCEEVLAEVAGVWPPIDDIISYLLQSGAMPRVHVDLFGSFSELRWESRVIEQVLRSSKSMIVGARLVTDELHILRCLEFIDDGVVEAIVIEDPDVGQVFVRRTRYESTEHCFRIADGSSSRVRLVEHRVLADRKTP